MNAVQEILVGDSNVVLTGGSDSMSACPYAVRDIRSDTDGIFNGFSLENNVNCHNIRKVLYSVLH